MGAHRSSVDATRYFKKMSDRQLAELYDATKLSEKLAEALSPDSFDNARRLQKGPVRTLDDMQPEEKRGLEQIYGRRICERSWRRNE